MYLNSFSGLTVANQNILSFEEHAYISFHISVKKLYSLN